MGFAFLWLLNCFNSSEPQFFHRKMAQEYIPSSFVEGLNEIIYKNVR